MSDKKITPEQKVEDPTGNYGSPADVVKDKQLTTEQKHDALTAWEQDAVRLSVATEEGMSGGEPSRLDEVKEAQNELPGKASKSRPSPTKAG
jgi:hypothetical protein